MQKQFAVICLDMHTLSIFQKENSNNSLSSSLNTCLLIILVVVVSLESSLDFPEDFPRTSCKLWRKVYRTSSYNRWHCKSLATSLNLRKGNLNSGLLEWIYILSCLESKGQHQPVPHHPLTDSLGLFSVNEEQENYLASLHKLLWHIQLCES